MKDLLYNKLSKVSDCLRLIISSILVVSPTTKLNSANNVKPEWTF